MAKRAKKKTNSKSKKTPSKSVQKSTSPKRDAVRLYADWAAATPMQPRLAKRLPELFEIYGNPGSLHKEGVAAKAALEEARKKAAESIGAHPDEIIFTSGGTEANNLALLGSLRPLLRQHGDVHAITLAIEHSSIIEPLTHLKKYGLKASFLPVEEDGRVLPKGVAEAISPETALVSVQLVNSEIGTIEPVREIGKFIRYARKIRSEAGQTMPLLFHTDGAQAPLYVPLNVERLGIDLLTLDAQKVGGPKGIGLLYVRRETPLEAILFGGGQENGLRSGTENAPLALLFADALSEAQDKAEVRAQKLSRVRDALWSEIQKKLPGAVLNGSLKERSANNLNISIPGLDGERTVIALDAMGIAISTRSACDAKDASPSAVLTGIGLDEKRARESIRLTLPPDATLSDVRRITQALLRARELYGES